MQGKSGVSEVDDLFVARGRQWHEPPLGQVVAEVEPPADFVSPLLALGKGGSVIAEAGIVVGGESIQVPGDLVTRLEERGDLGSLVSDGGAAAVDHGVEGWGSGTATERHQVELAGRVLEVSVDVTQVLGEPSDSGLELLTGWQHAVL